MLFQSVISVALACISLCRLVNGQYYAISGVQDNVNSVTGERPKRLNIDTLQSDPISWSLYVQALYAWQQDRTNLDSYLQVAGIHGRPYTRWNNVAGPGGFTDPGTGYCTHSSILFPTWHRPYLALFEKRINTYALAVASAVTGPNSAAWVAAAHNLRIPYWDWARSASIPSSCSTPMITIATSTGSRTIANPLYQYNMTGNFPASTFPDLPRYPTTVRCPNPGSQVSNTLAANAALNREPFRSYIYNLLTQDITYTTFASMANRGASLEGIHGSVHVDVGGAGHMSMLSYSAFDPIFWLHHTNCDRMFAIWQAVWPNKWLPNNQGPDSKSSSTFTIQSGPGRFDESYEALTPFSRSTSGTPYTSDLSRTTRLFGYTYPELEDWNKTPAQLTSAVKAAVNRLYGPTAIKKRTAKSEMRVARTVKTGIADEKQFYASIAVDKYALPSGFVVCLFLGTPPTDTSTWRYAQNLAGSMPVFKPPKPKDTSGNGNGEFVVYGEVPLDTGLEYAGYGKADHEAVIAYLVKNLCWRIQSMDGQVVDNKAVGSLKVQVYDKDVELPDDESMFPKYGSPVYRPEITKGKAGGI